MKNGINNTLKKDVKQQIDNITYNLDEIIGEVIKNAIFLQKEFKNKKYFVNDKEKVSKAGYNITYDLFKLLLLRNDCDGSDIGLRKDLCSGNEEKELIKKNIKKDIEGEGLDINDDLQKIKKELENFSTDTKLLKNLIEKIILIYNSTIEINEKINKVPDFADVSNYYEYDKSKHDKYNISENKN